MGVGEEPIGLADAIGRVRAELLQAQREGQHEDLRFRLGEVNLEFQVELKREASGEAGVKLWVVSVGAKGTVASARTHTVSVSLVPQAQAQDGQWADVMVGEEAQGRPPASRSAQH